MGPVFSIIIPTFQRPDSVLKLIEELRAQQDSPSFEIIVVDDSTSESLQAQLQQQEGILYLTTAQEGPGQARNYGASKANGDFLIFIDDDCSVQPNWLRILADEISKSSANIYYGPITSSAHSYKPFLHTVEIADTPYRSSNIAFDREFFSQLGGFDPQLSRWAEGWDLVTRARRQGAQLRYLSAWSCYHAPQYAAPRYFNLTSDRHMLGRMTYLLRRHLDSHDVTNYLSQLFSTYVWHTAIRLSFLFLPTFFVSFKRSLIIFVLMSIAYDALRLFRIQNNLLQAGFSLNNRDALCYMALNWFSDLKQFAIGAYLFVYRFGLRNKNKPTALLTSYQTEKTKTSESSAPEPALQTPS